MKSSHRLLFVAIIGLACAIPFTARAADREIFGVTELWLGDPQVKITNTPARINAAVPGGSGLTDAGVTNTAARLNTAVSSGDGSLALTSNLTVNGTSTENAASIGSLSVTTNATVAGTLGVTGVATLGGTNTIFTSPASATATQLVVTATLPIRVNGTNYNIRLFLPTGP